MNYVGAAAGGTLGFILGDIPGAVEGASIGANYGNKFTQSMKRSRSVSRGRTMARKPALRGRSISFGRRIKRAKNLYTKRFKKRRRGRKSYGASLRRAGYQAKRRKKVYFKSKKLRISRKFRRKVLRVITNSKFSGFYQHNSYTVHRASTDQGAQNVFQHSTVRVKDEQNPSDPDYACPLFSPSVFAYVAETLYGNANGPLYTDANHTIPVGGMLDTCVMNTAKIPVMKSWARFCIKNNYTFNVELKMYICSPKQKCGFYRNPIPTLTAASATPVDPLFDWFTQMDNLRYSYTSHYGTLMRQPQAKGQAAKTPAPYTGIAAYGADPRQLPWWNKHWKCDVEKFTIYPGQCIEKIVKGPRDMLIDMSRLWDQRMENQSGSVSTWFPGGGSFEEVQKWNQYVFWTSAPELSAFIPEGGTTKAGRVAWPDENDGEGILIEQKFYSKIGLPDEVARRNENAYQADDFLRENQKRDVLFIMNQPVKVGAYVTGDTIRTTQNSGVHEFTFTA